MILLTISFQAATEIDTTSPLHFAVVQMNSLQNSVDNSSTHFAGTQKNYGLTAGYMFIYPPNFEDISVLG